jgi:hypothetical protein
VRSARASRSPLTQRPQAKRAKVPRDPLKPKRPMTSFFLFIKDKRLEIAKDVLLRAQRTRARALAAH